MSNKGFFENDIFGEIIRPVLKAAAQDMFSIPKTPTASPFDTYDDVGDAYELRVDVPGIAKDDLQISVVEDTVTLKGVRRGRARTQDLNFKQSFYLPQGVDPEGMEAGMKDGVLTLRLPKRAQPEARRIPIRGD